MSKLFDDASLAMIPSAYKDGKLYSIRPIPEYGAELVTNGGFDTDSDWIKGTNWAISSGSLNATSATDKCEQNTSVTTNKTYLVSYNITNYVSGSVRIELSSGNVSVGATNSGNGFYSEEITALGDGYVLIDAMVTFTGSIDNVSVKEVLKPSGDFTFSRGSNLAATRVDANGLIEKGRENILTYSNTFDSGNWLSSNISLTSGQGGYDGSNDAWLIQGSGVGSSRLQLNGLDFSTSLYALSFYAKAGTENVVNIYDGTWGGVIICTFDLNTGNTTSSNATLPVIDVKMDSVGNGWYRCSVIVLPPNARTNTSGFVRIGIGSTTAANSGNLYIQDAQLEQGLVATDYIETGTSAAQSGILEDMPRLDYSGGASCPSLLLEPQRTNLITQSEYFGSSDWSKSGASVVGGFTSPEGLGNAYKLVEDTSTGIHRVEADGISISANRHNVSVFVKPNGRNEIRISLSNYFSSGTDAYFNLDTKVITYGTRAANGLIETFANGWFRCSFSSTSGEFAGPNAKVYIDTALSNSNSYQGDGTSGVYIYSAQLEQGSYPTSYIPTYGTSQTRSEDNMETGTLDTLTSYSMLVDIKWLKDIGGSATFIDKGVASSNFGRIFLKNGSDISYFSSSTGYLDNDLSLSDGAQHKYLLRVTNGFIEEFFDGVKQTNTDTNSNDLFKGLEIPTSDAQLNLNQLLVFPTALTDSECIALTTIA